MASGSMSIWNLSRAGSISATAHAWGRDVRDILPTGCALSCITSRSDCMIEAFDDRPQAPKLQSRHVGTTSICGIVAMWLGTIIQSSRRFSIPSKKWLIC